MKNDIKDRTSLQASLSHLLELLMSFKIIQTSPFNCEKTLSIAQSPAFCLQCVMQKYLEICNKKHTLFNIKQKTYSGVRSALKLNVAIIVKDSLCQEPVRLVNH